MNRDPSTPSGPGLHADGRVAVDLPCVHCGYNLRTLAGAGMCPECGKPVADTIHGQYLWQGPASWVRILEDSALCLTFCVGATLALGVIAATVGIMAFFSEFPAVILGACALVFVVVVPIVALAALLGLTEPKPGRMGGESRFAARRIIRWCLLLIPVTIVAFVGASSLSALWPLRGVEAPVFFCGAYLFVVTIPLALCHHLGDLMRRIPRRDLVRFANVEFWAIAATMVLLAVTLVLSGPLRSSSPIGWWDLTALVGAAGAFAVGTAGFVLLIRVTRALRTARRRAEQLAANDAPPKSERTHAAGE